MLRWVVVLLLLLMFGSVSHSQNTASVNTPPGYIWTYLGATFGADWAPPPGQVMVTPGAFGCIGNGVVDDTVCMQNAINQTVAVGGTLVLDGIHRYLVSAPLHADGNVNIQGTNGRMGGLNYSGAQFSCPSGIITNSNIVVLYLKGSSYVVQNVCFNLASTPGTRTAGAAISVGSPSGTTQMGGLLQGNTIINPYEGILVDSDPAGSQLGTQQIVLRDNIVRDPTHMGIVWGRSTVNDGTSGTMINNMVSCGTVTGAAAYGNVFYDGDVDYDGKNNGEGDCFIGTAIIPGLLHGNNQNFGAHFKNVVGDSNGTHATGGQPYSLLIQPATNGIIGFLTFTNVWASGGTTPGGVKPIMIDCTAPQPLTCWQISFNQLTSRSAGPVSTLMTVKGAVWNFQLQNSLLCSWFAGAVTTGLELDFNATTAGHWQIQNNRIGNCAGSGGNTMTNGIVLNSNGGNMWLNLTGNDASDATNPYLTNISAIGDVTAGNNTGADEVIPSIPVASSFGLPGFNKTYNMTGGGTIASIVNGWFGREVTLLASTTGTGFTFSHAVSGTNVGVCSAADDVVAAGIAHHYIFTATNCWLRVQ